VSFGPRKETVDEINEVYTDKKAPFPIYRDLNNTLYEKLRCEGTPHWIFMDGQGKVIHSLFGSQDGAKLKISFAIDEMKSEFS
jgi:thioredoxin-related protein